MELLLDTLKWSVIVGTAALALTLLKPLLDRRYSAKWRYGVWLVMAAFLLLAPVQWEALAPEEAVLATPPVVIEVPRVEVSVSRQEGVSFQRPTAAPAAFRPAGTSAAKKATVPLEKILTGLWLGGMGLFFLYHLIGTWCFNRRARRWSRRAGEDTLRIYEAARQELGLKKAPPLRLSGAVDSPMVIGLFRPCLMLPGEDFGERELVFILRHELTHYRRRDLWYKLVLLAANGMHWFNPLAYLLRREAERDLELTCDDAVVAGRDDMERRAYSEALLASIHRQKGLSRAALSTHFYGGKEVMMERFRNILGKRGRKWGGLALALALLATVAAACTFGVQATADGALSEEELAAWQEKLDSEEMQPYLYRMYTDVSLLPSRAALAEMSWIPEDEVSYRPSRAKVLSGTKNGDAVALEIAGSFTSGLPTGTLTLVNEEPVSFTTPLYTAAETAARELMERTAGDYISWSAENPSIAEPLEFTEKYITGLTWLGHVNAGSTSYYAWAVHYRMKPNDMSNVLFAGGMSEENGWVTESSSMGIPYLIFSADSRGNIVMEEQGWAREDSQEAALRLETNYTWEEYLYCSVYLGMEEMHGILNGWPEISTPFLESLRDGHDTWALDWQDVAISYLGRVYGIYADGGVTELRTFTASNQQYDHDQAMLVQAACGERTVTLLLAHTYYPVEGWVWEAESSFWQVVGVKWEPDEPVLTIHPAEPEESGSSSPAGVLAEDELASITNYFNASQHNGLLRFPYTSLGTARPYMGLLFYDMGNPVTDEEELEAVAELYGGELFTDCTKLTREELRAYLSQNFTHKSANIFAADLKLVMDSIPDMPYLEEYDAYYMVHGDTMMNQYTFDRVERDGNGVVSLYYTTDLWQYNDSGELDLLWDQSMCAAMVPNGNNGWLMLSNQNITESVEF